MQRVETGVCSAALCCFTTMSARHLCVLSQRSLLSTFVLSHREVCSAPLCCLTEKSAQHLCSLTKKSAQHLCVVSQRSLLSTFVLSHKEVCSAPFFLLSHSLHTIRSSFTTEENATTNNKLPLTAICYRGVDQWYSSFYKKSFLNCKKPILLVEATHLLLTSSSSISWWCAPQNTLAGCLPNVTCAVKPKQWRTHISSSFFYRL